MAVRTVFGRTGLSSGAYSPKRSLSTLGRGAQNATPAFSATNRAGPPTNATARSPQSLAASSPPTSTPVMGGGAFSRLSAPARAPAGETYGSQRATVPTTWQSAPNHPPTQLAYVTAPEAQMLTRADIHGSGLNREAHYGPGGIPSYNGAGGQGGREGGSDRGGREGGGGRAGAVGKSGVGGGFDGGSRGGVSAGGRTGGGGRAGAVGKAGVGGGFSPGADRAAQDRAAADTARRTGAIASSAQPGSYGAAGLDKSLERAKAQNSMASKVGGIIGAGLGLAAAGPIGAIGGYKAGRWAGGKVSGFGGFGGLDVGGGKGSTVSASRGGEGDGGLRGLFDKAVAATSAPAVAPAPAAPAQTPPAPATPPVNPIWTGYPDRPSPTNIPYAGGMFGAQKAPQLPFVMPAPQSLLPSTSTPYGQY